MRICHVTAHLPPDQAANALLPWHLGVWAREAGHHPRFVAHPARAAGLPSAGLPGPVTWIPRRERRHPLAKLKLASAVATFGLARRISPALRDADLVHVHSNGLLAETAAWVAHRLRKPYVLTLYGTEIWHYGAARRPIVDLFTRAYARAAAVTFYSHGLLQKAVEIGLSRTGLTVVYPPVASDFRIISPEDRRRIRATLDVDADHLLLNVKRLHPLAAHHTLLDAMPLVLQRFPRTHLLICGTGQLAEELASRSRALHLARHVTFAGLVDNSEVARYDAAADVFVLPSLLEACPTVAIEALACGTPVVSTDNPGGVELRGLFGDDVSVVPRSDPAALGRAIIDRLERNQRTHASTGEVIERVFRPGTVFDRYAAIYRQALGEVREAG